MHSVPITIPGAPHNFTLTYIHSQLSSFAYSTKLTHQSTQLKKDNEKRTMKIKTKNKMHLNSRKIIIIHPPLHQLMRLCNNHYKLYHFIGVKMRWELGYQWQNWATSDRTGQPVPELCYQCQNWATSARTGLPVPELGYQCQNCATSASQWYRCAPKLSSIF